VDIRKL